MLHLCMKMLELSAFRSCSFRGPGQLISEILTSFQHPVAFNVQLIWFSFYQSVSDLQSFSMKNSNLNTQTHLPKLNICLISKLYINLTWSSSAVDTVLEAWNISIVHYERKAIILNCQLSHLSYFGFVIFIRKYQHQIHQKHDLKQCASNKSCQF